MVVRKDHVRAEVSQLGHEGRLGVHDDGSEAETRAGQQALGQLGVPGFVLHDQDAGASGSPAWKAAVLTALARTLIDLTPQSDAGISSGAGSFSSSQKTPSAPTTSANSANFTGLRT